MPPDQSPYIERYGYNWLQHSDGLYYGPRYPERMASSWSWSATASLAIARYAGGSIGIS
jgi:hypothetical protein